MRSPNRCVLISAAVFMVGCSTVRAVEDPDIVGPPIPTMATPKNNLNPQQVGQRIITRNPTVEQLAHEAVSRALGTNGIPKDKYGQVCQIGGCMPAEIPNLPSLAELEQQARSAGGVR